MLARPFRPTSEVAREDICRLLEDEGVPPEQTEEAYNWIILKQPPRRNYSLETGHRVFHERLREWKAAHAID